MVMLDYIGRKQRNIDDAAVADLSVQCVRYPLSVKKAISLKRDQSVLRVSEDVFNTGEQKVEFSWVQHIAFGEPFLDTNVQIEILGVKGKTHDYELPHERLARNREFNWPFAPGVDGSSIVDLTKIPGVDSRSQDDLAITEFRERKHSLYNATLDLGA